MGSDETRATCNEKPHRAFPLGGVVTSFRRWVPAFRAVRPTLDKYSVSLHAATDAEPCLQGGRRPRPLSTTPPTVPRANISTAPPSTANSEPESPGEERARMTLFAAPRGAAALPPRPSRLEWAGRVAVREPGRGGPPELCEPMPAPKRPSVELAAEEAPAPVCLACARGSAYSLAAGEPGSMFTRVLVRQRPTAQLLLPAWRAIPSSHTGQPPHARDENRRIV